MTEGEKKTSGLRREKSNREILAMANFYHPSLKAPDNVPVLFVIAYTKHKVTESGKVGLGNDSACGKN